jgi:hypothetical protein
VVDEELATTAANVAFSDMQAEVGETEVTTTTMIGEINHRLKDYGKTKFQY